MMRNDSCTGMRNDWWPQEHSTVIMSPLMMMMMMTMLVNMVMMMTMFTAMVMVMINKQTKITMSPFYQMWGNHDLYQDCVGPCYVFNNSDEKLDCSSGLCLGNKTMIIWGVSQKALI